ncbi:MAG: DUF883 family protein [Gammaproteobacteria bacterium]|jgi:ElaB/YqjD/DUF883 family membrane-anchored ribosome-binding protein|nr:DUF883 family protein [Gammaproteobacteria bacterium]
MSDVRDARDRLEEDFRRVVRDAEALLRATADQGGDAVSAARARAEETLREARIRLQQVEGDLVQRTRAAARATDELVHDKPWQAVGIAAGVGFLIGMLSGRR